MNNAQALERCISCLLSNTAAGSKWGDFQNDWDPIITALTSGLLLSVGLTKGTPWYVEQMDSAACELKDTFKWLNNSIRPNGSFGTDFWDAVQLAIVIKEHRLESDFNSLPSLTQYIESVIQAGFEDSNSQWAGPGFPAAAVRYRHANGQKDLAGQLCELLRTQQRDDGAWVGVTASDGTPTISPAWHTAQSVISLWRHDRVQYADNIARGLEWLKKTQGRNGSWPSVKQYEIYFTAYAVLALALEPIAYRAEIDKAVSFLKGQIGPDGKCSDLGGTLMCALALEKIVDRKVDEGVTFIDCLLARQNITRALSAERKLLEANKENTDLKTKLDEHDKRFRDAHVVLTKKEVFLGFTIIPIIYAVVVGLSSADSPVSKFLRWTGVTVSQSSDAGGQKSEPNGGAPVPSKPLVSVPPASSMAPPPPAIAAKPSPEQSRGNAPLTGGPDAEDASTK